MRRPFFFVVGRVGAAFAPADVDDPASSDTANGPMFASSETFVFETRRSPTPSVSNESMRVPLGILDAPSLAHRIWSFLRRFFAREAGHLGGRHAALTPVPSAFFASNQADKLSGRRARHLF